VFKNNSLSSRVTLFLKRYVTSVEHLEILSFLTKTSGESSSVENINELLRSSPNSIEHRLEEFCKFGLLQKTDSTPPLYRYAPRSEELRQDVEEVLNAYKRFRLRVIEAIFSGPSSDIKHFSEAFRLKRYNCEEEDG
jgi:hypothetical protein